MCTCLISRRAHALAAVGPQRRLISRLKILLCTVRSDAVVVAMPTREEFSDEVTNVKELQRKILNDPLVVTQFIEATKLLRVQGPKAKSK
jgi:hypothetical protein